MVQFRTQSPCGTLVRATCATWAGTWELTWDQVCQNKNKVATHNTILPPYFCVF